MKKILFSFIFIFFLVFPIFILAEQNLEIDYPEFGGVTLESTAVGLPNYIRYIFTASVAISGIVIFSILIYAGYLYLISAGDMAKTGDAKDRIISAFAGILVILSSYIVLKTIDPQLIFLNNLDISSIPGISPPVALEKENIFYYKEIPIGGLAAEMFSEERLEKIKEASEKIKEKSERVKFLSEEINNLVNENCKCDNCYKGNYYTAGKGLPMCGKFEPYHCTFNCNCQGGPIPTPPIYPSGYSAFSYYDPCGKKRYEIDFYRKEMKVLQTSNSEDGISYWQKKLDVEINGSDEDKYLGFKKLYEDLLVSEDLIKNCKNEKSKYGKLQTLLTYNQFWDKEKALEKDPIIKEIEGENPFPYISPDNVLKFNNFYCAELLLPNPLANSSFLAFDIAFDGNNSKTYCSSQIKIGEAVDNSEKIAKKILQEAETILENIPEQKRIAEKFWDLPQECECDRCESRSYEYDSCCFPCYPCPPSSFENKLLKIFSVLFVPKNAFAATIHEKETNDNCPCGCQMACYRCECRCVGDVCPFQEIKEKMKELVAVSQKISDSSGEIYEIIDEENIDDDSLKISIALTDFKSSQSQFLPCYIDQATIRQFKDSKGAIEMDSLWSCSLIKEFANKGVYYYDNKGRQITDCYSSLDNSENFDNYICCTAKYSF